MNQFQIRRRVIGIWVARVAGIEERNGLVDDQYVFSWLRCEGS